MRVRLQAQTNEIDRLKEQVRKLQEELKECECKERAEELTESEPMEQEINEQVPLNTSFNLFAPQRESRKRKNTSTNSPEPTPPPKQKKRRMDLIGIYRLYKYYSSFRLFSRRFWIQNIKS